MEKPPKSHNQQYLRSLLTKEKFKLRNKIDRLAGIPFALLGFIWFNLLVFYMIYKQDSFLEGASAIWILFQAELILKIYLSPSTGTGLYFKKNPVVAVSAIIPAIRVIHLYRYTIFSESRRKNQRQKVFNS
ncbi:MAG TPA: hypothetical protein VNW99_08825 [Cytophagaceae bacterium]|jgi:hypothetical protein|nr:hypothetical protein [Cytophagaceae bacterium]